MKIKVFTIQRKLFLIEALELTDDFFVIENPTLEERLDCLIAVKVVYNDKEYFIQKTDIWMQDNLTKLYLYIKKHSI